MEECRSTATPMNQKEKFYKEDGAAKIDETLYRTLIGCLMYLTATRPNIMNATSILSRYMHCASEIHFQAAKRIVRYIKGTIDYGLKFCQVKNSILHGYSDSDWASCVDDRALQVIVLVLVLPFFVEFKEARSHCSIHS